MRTHLSFQGIDFTILVMGSCICSIGVGILRNLFVLSVSFELQYKSSETVTFRIYSEEISKVVLSEPSQEFLLQSSSRISQAGMYLVLQWKPNGDNVSC